MWKKGSYTVEASLLMGILIPLFLAIIYLGFYLHDKAFLQSAALETVVCADLQNSELGEKKDVTGLGEQLVQERTIGARKPDSSMSLDKDRVYAAYKEKIKILGMISNYILGGSLTINVKKEISLKNPGDMIRKMKGLQKLMGKGEAD